MLLLLLAATISVAFAEDASATVNYTTIPPPTPQSTTPPVVDPPYYPLDTDNSVDFTGLTDEEPADNSTTLSHVMLTTLSTDCQNIDLEHSISEIRSHIELHGEWCCPGPFDWSLSAAVKFKVLGHAVINERLHLSPRGSYSVRKKINLFAAKADITVGIYDMCIRITGEACYWAGKWRCADIYEQPHCFRNKKTLKAQTMSGVTMVNMPGGGIRYSAQDDCPARLKKIAELAHMEL